MLPPVRSAVRSLPSAVRVSRGQFANRRYFRQTGIFQAEGPSRPRPKSRKVAFIIAAAVGAAALYLVYPTQAQEPVLARAEVKVEEPRKTAQSSEENRDLISAQHLQIKKSWENPGVYAWGSNIGRVVAPDSEETIVKKPRRIPYFDGKLLRDIKLDKYFGAAIGENGDLLQWGTGFSPDSQGPTPTLKGKDLVKLSISRDRVIALSSNGTVYSIPASQSEAEIESKSNPEGSSWFQFWKTGPSFSYETLKPTDLGWGEKVTDVSCGQEHCLALTSAGRVFSCAIGNGNFTSKGQLGIDNAQLKQPHDSNHLNKVDGLQPFKIAKIATGDYHSLLLDTEGRVHSFGDNSSGQLGFEESPDNRVGTLPTLIAPDSSNKYSSVPSRVIDIAAGGANSFITIESAVQDTENGSRERVGTTVDTWAFGQGITGALGNGRWTHVQSTPTKVKALSGLREYDETKNDVVPIRVSHISVGATHSCAVLDNATNLRASSRSSKNDTNFGADVLWWGGNEFYQLGTGKRNNVNAPTYIPPLDLVSNDAGNGEEYRFQLTPRKKISVGGRKVSVEQRVECGRGTTAVYSGT